MPVAHASSFSVLGDEPAAIDRALAGAVRETGAPSFGLFFTSGAWNARLADVADRVRPLLGDVPFVVVASGGVLTERGEIEHATAVAGLVVRGGQALPIVVPPSTTRDDVPAAAARAVAEAAGGRAATAVLFALPSPNVPAALEEIGEAAPKVTLVGAGTAPEGAIVVDASGAPRRGAWVGLALTGHGRALTRASPAVRLVTPIEPITHVRGPMVLRVGDRAALDVLAAGARGASDEPPLVFAILAAEGVDAAPGRGGLLVRAIRGVDQNRRGVVVGDDARHGARMGFAIRDGAASRENLEAATRDVARELGGAAPRFALFLSCAGRGAGLYGAPNVDTRTLRAAFPGLPIAGMFSSFEIGPYGAGAGMHLYTGVLAMTTVAS